MWAGMSSGPSIVCVQYGASSGTASLNQASKSSRTSGEAFSFSVSDADVWRMNTCSSPTREVAQLRQRLEHVARDQVKAARARPQGDLALDPHAAYGIRAARMSTLLAAERHALGLQQRALARALGQRPVGAHDPPPRQRRIAVGVQHRAREARRAGGDVAVGADEALGHRADALEHARPRVRSRRRMRPSSRAMRHGTYSIVARDPETGELGAAVQSHWFSVGSLCVWARPGVGAVATQSVVEPAHGPNALDRLAEGASAQQALGDAARRRPARRTCARSASSTPRRVAVHTGADCIAHAGHVTGEHHSCQANMMARDTVPAGDVGRVRGRRRARSPTA